MFHQCCNVANVRCRGKVHGCIWSSINIVVAKTMISGPRKSNVATLPAHLQLRTRGHLVAGLLAVDTPGRVSGWELLVVANILSELEHKQLCLGKTSLRL